MLTQLVLARPGEDADRGSMSEPSFLAGRFLPHYVDGGIYEDDPFQVLDRKGVGKLVKWAVRDGRDVKPGLKVGLCGEHGGEPRSVAFCHEAGLDYVSCSPFRVPVARLAAAHAALADSAGDR